MPQAKQKYLEASRNYEEHLRGCDDCQRDKTTGTMFYCDNGEELASVMDHFALEYEEESSEMRGKGPEIYVYSYLPKGASKQRRFAVATGNGPNDVKSTHGTKDVAVRKAEKMAEKTSAKLVIEI